MKDLIFIDESGVNLAMVRLYARSLKGERAGCISLLRICQKRVKMKKLVKSSNKDEVKKMTPSDQEQLKVHLKAAAEIL